MEFYPDLYIGEKVEKPGVLLKKIKKQKKIPDAYIIAFAQSADDELDIRNGKSVYCRYSRGLRRRSGRGEKNCGGVLCKAGRLQA